MWVFSNNRSATLDHAVNLLASPHFHKKPLCAAQLIDELALEGAKTAVIGDRLLTDMCLGHMMGGLSIYVRPWDISTEQRGLRLARRFENWLWSGLMKRKLALHECEAVKDLANGCRL